MNSMRNILFEFFCIISDKKLILVGRVLLHSTQSCNIIPCLHLLKTLKTPLHPSISTPQLGIITSYFRVYGVLSNQQGIAL